MIEDLEKELVLTAPGSGKLDRLSGEGKEGLDAVRSDVAADLIDPIIAHLVGEGILTSTAGISRRGLALPGAAGALSGVTVLAMPSASMATSSSAALATPILSPNRGVIGAYVGARKRERTRR